MNSRIGPKNQIPKNFANLAQKYRISIRKYEESPCFGNILLIVASDNCVYRFTRDRGYNACEVCRDEEREIWESVWVEKMFGITESSTEFPQYVEKILTMKNLNR